MPDPHDEVSLRGYSGLDKPVIDFFARHRDRVDRFLDAANGHYLIADGQIMV